MKFWNILNIIAYIILLVGGINWLLIGLFDFNLVAAIFGNASVVSRIIYSIVGFCALYLIVIPFFQNGTLRFRGREE